MDKMGCTGTAKDRTDKAMDRNGTAMDRTDKAMDRIDIVFMIYGHVSELYFGRMLRYDGKPGVGVSECGIPECEKHGDFGLFNFPLFFKILS